MSELAGTFVDVTNTPRETAEAAAIPEKLSGAWVFILIECLTFSAYFVMYMLYRMHDPQTFRAAQVHLHPTFGMVNTLLLLTSSWQVARSIHSARANDYSAAFRQALLTVGLGAAFVVSKTSEWAVTIGSGYNFQTNDFFAFYFFLTGIHIVHVLVGFVFMAVALYHLRDDEPSSLALEIGAVYWHMVDFLWIVIFTLLYVVK